MHKAPVVFSMPLLFIEQLSCFLTVWKKQVDECELPSDGTHHSLLLQAACVPSITKALRNSELLLCSL